MTRITKGNTGKSVIVETQDGSDTNTDGIALESIKSWNVRVDSDGAELTIATEEEDFNYDLTRDEAVVAMRVMWELM